MEKEYILLNKIEQQLVEEMEQIVTIDCHEHLLEEDQRVNADTDVFTLFTHYTRHELINCGMSEAEYRMLHNKDIPLDVRWRKFEPYWNNIRYSSYARAALIAARKFYGVDDINSSTYIQLSENIKNANKPGLYKRVLKDACNIGVSLLQINYPFKDVDKNFFAPVVHMTFFDDTCSWEGMSRPSFNPKALVNTLDDYIYAAEEFVSEMKSKGAVGLKMPVRETSEPSRQEALRIFEKLRDGTIDRLPKVNPLYDYVIDQIIRMAEEYDLVLAVHTGYWGDFRTLNPLYIIPLVIRHPKARFDIFHLGYPWVRETLMLGKGFPNVWLNLCWTHIISQKFATEALNEAVELVPANKILAFGADYGLPVEKVYGHLIMAREDIARALSPKIESGQITFSQAKDIMKKWLHDNPKELYKLDL